jgi:hypothetical protein
MTTVKRKQDSLFSAFTSSIAIHKMFQKSYIPALTAIIGFLCAWFLKPSKENQVDATVSRPNTSTHSTAYGLDPTRDKPKPALRDPSLTTDGKPLPPEILQARAGMGQAAQNGFALKDQAYIQRLTELMSLTASQQQEMLALFQEKRSSMNFYQNGLPGGNILELAEQAEKKFNDSLSKLLSPAQIEQLNAVRKQQSQNRAMASAQKEYAELLEKVDLSQEQQNAVLTSLQQASAAELANASETSRFFAETFDSMGYGVAGAALAEKSTANASIQNASDPQEALRLAAEQRKNASAAKIEQMRTILTPAQLQQYAAMIQIRDQNYYAGLTRGSNLPNR